MAKIEARKRHTIRKSKLSKLRKGLEEQIGQSAEQFTADNIEMVETTSDITLYLIDRKPLLMEKDGWFFPTLRGAVDRPFPERRITVDSGAISFMVNGADVMRPGVTDISPDVRKDMPVLIVEEKYKKPLCIAIALFDAEEMEKTESGKVAQNIHYVSDDIWNLEI